MAKAIMVSIQPEWVRKIMNGDKTVEIRKTRPWVPGEAIKAYIYCTASTRRSEELWKESDNGFRWLLNGDVIGEFAADRFVRLVRIGNGVDAPCYCECLPGGSVRYADRILADAGLSYDALEAYLRGRQGWAWHISELKIYDSPKSLGAFTGLRATRFGREPYQIRRPPQSWYYVEELEDG